MIDHKTLRIFSVSMMFLALLSISCGVSGLPFLATETPTPTTTFTPTPTFTPSPTSTPTETPTATPLPTGRVKKEQEDGTTVFHDYDGGYKITFPENWVVVIPTERDIEDILNSFPDQEQSISSIVDLVKKSGGEMYRIFAFNFKATENLYTPNINIAYQKNMIMSAISMEELITANAEMFPSLGIKVVDKGVKESSTGVEIGFIDVNWTINAAGNQKIELLQKQIYFQSGEGMAAITLSTTKNNSADFTADLEKIVESIELLEN